MNNEHTPGFYAVEEYRCMHAHNAVKAYTSTCPENSDYRIKILFDCINAVQNSPTAQGIQVDRAEDKIYRKTQKESILMKLLNRTK